MDAKKILARRSNDNVTYLFKGFLKILEDLKSLNLIKTDFSQQIWCPITYSIIALSARLLLF